MALNLYATCRDRNRRVIGTEDFAALLIDDGNNFHKICEAFGITEHDLREAMLDRNVEQCKKCSVWGHSFEMLNDHSEPDGMCDGCRPDSGPEELC